MNINISQLMPASPGDICANQGYLHATKCSEVIQSQLTGHTLAIYAMLLMFLAALIVMEVQRRTIKRLNEKLQEVQKNVDQTPLS